MNFYFIKNAKYFPESAVIELPLCEDEGFIELLIFNDTELIEKSPAKIVWDDSESNRYDGPIYDLKNNLPSSLGDMDYCIFCNDQITSKVIDHCKLCTAMPRSDERYKYNCNSCTYHAYNRYHMMVHLNTHKKYRPFKCNDCSYSAIQKSRLREHMRTHTGEKPFKCSLCTYKCAVGSTLKAHIKMKHNLNN